MAEVRIFVTCISLHAFAVVFVVDIVRTVVMTLAVIVTEKLLCAGI